MPSTILRRVFGENSVFGERSIYDDIEDHDADEEAFLRDLEDQAGMISGDYNDNFGTEPTDPSPYGAYRDDPTTNTAPAQHAGIQFLDRTGSGGRAPALMNSTYQSYLQENRRPNQNRGMGQSRANNFFGANKTTSIEADEVPQSLLMEGGAGATDGYTRDRYNATKAGVYDSRQPSQIPTTYAEGVGRVRTEEEERRARLGLIDPKERALWKWANVTNLDNFLLEIYNYWHDNGIYSIVLGRLLNLFTLGFTFFLTTSLMICVDYKQLQHARKLEEVVIPHCMSRMSYKMTTIYTIFSCFWVFKLLQLCVDLIKMWELHNFFKYLLDLSEDDLQSVTWQKVVERLMALRDENPHTSSALKRKHSKTQSKQRMDAHDIANRLMRKDNYMIALFNKDILNLTIPFPFFRNQGSILTRTLEWNLWLCVTDYVFSPSGQLRAAFLKESERKKLSEGLRRRFVITGAINLILSPIIATFAIVLYFLRYFNEFKVNPGTLGHRQYTPLAEWKFREFNELPHLFTRRMWTSYPYASRYVDQFPKEKTVQLAKFATFITGSLLAVLIIPSFIDSEFFSFELADRTVLFYIGILSAAFAVFRGMIPEDHLLYDPETAIRMVIQYTHYMPKSWANQLHSETVKKDFMRLYELKVMIFLQEVLSIIFTPFVLWFSLPSSCDRIVDFFREYTVHVDGMGYVCSHAVFDFQKNQSQVVAAEGEQYNATDKMMASVMGFIDNYGPKRASNSNKHAPYIPPAISDGMYDEMRPRSRGTATGIERGTGGTLVNRAGRNQGMTNSILLDSHHMPAPSKLKHAKFSSLNEEDEEAENGGTYQPYSGASQAKGKGRADSDGSMSPETREVFDSALDESFMSTGLAQTVGPGMEEGVREDGVLGLLYQFQKAQGGQTVPM
ncbi:APG9-domain-containing protein [Ascobolus immersus RN42]|uniref:Autophagy-related protein 9 n=1 Tax=Ascobolus immersus RN42 TaxID=1160509 RepID=A0A3N4HRY8_ASCIM|nr:APG9-domain-containing protein [Ascobolus immersus RN42]